MRFTNRGTITTILFIQVPTAINPGFGLNFNIYSPLSVLKTLNCKMSLINCTSIQKDLRICCPQPLYPSSWLSLWMTYNTEYTVCSGRKIHKHRIYLISYFLVSLVGPWAQYNRALHLAIITSLCIQDTATANTYTNKVFVTTDNLTHCQVPYFHSEHTEECSEISSLLSFQYISDEEFSKVGWRTPNPP